MGQAAEISETPLLDRLSSSVFISVELGRLYHAQCERRPAEFNTRSFVAGDRCPSKAAGLVGPGLQGPKVPLAPKLR